MKRTWGQKKPPESYKQQTETDLISQNAVRHCKFQNWIFGKTVGLYTSKAGHICLSCMHNILCRIETALWEHLDWLAYKERKEWSEINRKPRDILLVVSQSRKFKWWDVIIGAVFGCAWLTLPSSLLVNTLSVTQDMETMFKAHKRKAKMDYWAADKH